MEAYECFAEFYDALMKDADYKSRADYILKLFEKFNHPMGLTLDLACGTGSLTLELAKRGVDIYGTDASQEMLTAAMNKMYDAGLNILFLCQKMQEIDLYGTIDTCICTLDSINHITNPSDVQKTFDRVSLFMNPGGYFLFDVNTQYKHQNILADSTFVYDTDEVFCVWQNEPVDEDAVSITLDFFREESASLYSRSTESFCERAYSHKDICAMLENAGFSVEGYFGDLSFLPPEETEQRVIYAAKKN